MRESFLIADTEIKAGEHQLVKIQIGSLYTQTPINIPVYIFHGKKSGPVLLVTAAIHGDEINGVEIVRRLANYENVKRVHGTLILVPIVNVFGLIHRSRYLPDRRDLNRSFPGSPQGSLASRLAHIINKKLIAPASHTIDLHTGAVHRANMPQIRACLDDEATFEFAKAFGVPVIIDSPVREGSLRALTHKAGKITITYEAGEALRYEESAIAMGFKGVLNCMRFLEMLPKSKQRKRAIEESKVVNNSVWVRADVDGMMRPLVPLGASVTKGQALGVISDPLGSTDRPVFAPFDGIVIGRSNIPLVNEGEAFFNIAKLKNAGEVEQRVEDYMEELDQDDALEDPPIYCNKKMPQNCGIYCF